MPMPTIPTTLTAWEKFQAEVMIENAALLEAHRRVVEANDVKRIEALNAQAKAVADNGIAMAKAMLDSINVATPARRYTDEELVAMFVGSLVSTWGPGTTPSEIPVAAASLLAGFRKLFPAPAPAP